MAEIASNPRALKLAYTCKTADAGLLSDRFGHIRLRRSHGRDTNICKPRTALQRRMRARCATCRTRKCRATTNIPPGRPTGEDSVPLDAPRGQRIDKERLLVYDCTTGATEDLTEDFDYNAMNAVWDGNERLLFIAPIEATRTRFAA